jgi:hypothetical protein
MLALALARKMAQKHLVVMLIFLDHPSTQTWDWQRESTHVLQWVVWLILLVFRAVQVPVELAGLKGVVRGKVVQTPAVAITLLLLLPRAEAPPVSWKAKIPRQWRNVCPPVLWLVVLLMVRAWDVVQPRVALVEVCYAMTLVFLHHLFCLLLPMLLPLVLGFVVIRCHRSYLDDDSLLAWGFLRV